VTMEKERKNADPHPGIGAHMLKAPSIENGGW
jgi:hypothetical protein